MFPIFFVTFTKKETTVSIIMVIMYKMFCNFINDFVYYTIIFIRTVAFFL